MKILLIISSFWIFSEIFLTRTMRANESHTNHDKSSLKILWLTILLSITLGIIIRNLSFITIMQNDVSIYYLGISIICIGLIIRWISILKLKKSFTVNVSVSKNQEIVQSGIYKHIRHPAYLGSLLSFFGLAIVFNNWITLTIIFVPIFFSFMYRIYIEEKILSKVFGNQYTNYIANSWKLIPGIF